MTAIFSNPPEFFSFLPTSGDGPYLGSDIGHRPVSNRYLREIAVAADRLGYTGVLVPTGRHCEEPWITAASIAPFTEKLRFLLAVRTGLYTPALLSRQFAALDRLTGGRILANIVPGGSASEMTGDGIFLDHDARYDHAAEFCTVLKRLLQGEEVTFHGEHIHIERGRQIFPPVQRPHPPLYFGGSSDAAHKLVAEQLDAYLSWAEPVADVAAKIADVRARAARVGRTIRYGLRVHLIVRETDAEARAAAEKLISHLSDETIARTQAAFRTQSDSEGQRRMAALHQGRRDKLEIAPNLWAGVGLVRGGAGTALVGSPKTVATRLKEYADLGIDTFVTSGYPHLEETYRVAELLFPYLGITSPRGGVEPAPIADYVSTVGPGVLSAQTPPLRVASAS